MKRIMPAILSGNKISLAEVESMENVDVLTAQILHYLGKISQASLTENQTADFFKLMEAVNDLENICGR